MNYVINLRCHTVSSVEIYLSSCKHQAVQFCSVSNGTYTGTTKWK